MTANPKNLYLELTVSAFIRPILEDLPVFNVIEPGTQAALSKTRNRKIGLLGTRATIRSRAYEKALKKYLGDQPCDLFSIAAPLLVPLAEEGWDQIL